MKIKQMCSAAALLLVAVGTVQAAPVTVPVSGSWTGLLNWNPGGPGLPVVDPAGEGLVAGGPDMALTGSMTIDSVTNVISALELTGSTVVGPWSPEFNDEDPPEFTGGDVTWSGFSWSLSGTSLLQTGTPSLVCGEPTDAECGPGFANGAGAILTLSDFTGVPDFSVVSVPPGGVQPGCAGTTAGGVCLPARDGITSLIGGGSEVGDATTLDLWSAFNIVNIPGFTINSAVNGTFDLQVVPIPAAVWLFASGLLGLIGWGRRKATA